MFSTFGCRRPVPISPAPETPFDQKACRPCAGHLAVADVQKYLCRPAGMFALKPAVLRPNRRQKAAAVITQIGMPLLISVRRMPLITSTMRLVGNIAPHNEPAMPVNINGKSRMGARHADNPRAALVYDPPAGGLVRAIAISPVVSMSPLPADTVHLARVGAAQDAKQKLIAQDGVCGQVRCKRMGHL
jgi:hypothetical protein